MIEHEPIGTWEDFSRLIPEQFKLRWIYRGVRNTCTKNNLRPRIGRPLRRMASGLELPYARDKELKLFKFFQREARSNFAFLPGTELEWMILGQHHLLPTRLLDWSESLLVAAFFAVEDPLSKSPAIYAIEPPQELEDPSISPFSEELTEPCLVRPPHVSSRITSQKSVMTLHPNPNEPWTPDGMHRWPIASTFSFTLKGQLNFCGINEASLFPDSADRHTSHLAWLHKWDRF